MEQRVPSNANLPMSLLGIVLATDSSRLVGYVQVQVDKDMGEREERGSRELGSQSSRGDLHEALSSSLLWIPP